MNYTLKVTKEQIKEDIKRVIDQHEDNKIDLKPNYPEFESRFKTHIELSDYFFYNKSDKTQLSLHEYDNPEYFGLYFNHKDGDNDSWEPITKAPLKKMLSSKKLIDDIYKHLVDHISFMNTLQQ